VFEVVGLQRGAPQGPKAPMLGSAALDCSMASTTPLATPGTPETPARPGDPTIGPESHNGTREGTAAEGVEGSRDGKAATNAVAELTVGGGCGGGGSGGCGGCGLEGSVEDRLADCVSAERTVSGAEGATDGEADAAIDVRAGLKAGATGADASDRRTKLDEYGQ